METEKLQVGVIVEDLEAAMARGTELFGLGPWRVIDVPEAGVRAAMADWAGVEVELIVGANEQTKEQHQKMLKGKTARFTHLGAYVKDKDAEIARFEEEGVKVVYRDMGDDVMRTAMVDVRNEAGYLLELIERVG